MTAGRYATVRFVTLLSLALQLTFESRLSLFYMHIVGHAMLKAKFTPAVSSVQSLTPPPSLSVSPCDQIREKESLPLNTTIRSSKRKFAKWGHQVQVSRAPTAGMQWLILKKKMQSFYLQRPAVFMVFCDFRKTSDVDGSCLGQLQAE